MRLPSESDEIKMGSKGKNRDCKMSLLMECIDEDLSEAQQVAFNSAMSHYRETSNNIDELLRAGLVDVVERGREYITLEIKEGLNGVNGPKSKINTIQPRQMTPQNLQTPTSLLIQSPTMPQTATASAYQLVMDPRSLGLYVSTTNATSTNVATVPMMAGVLQSTPSSIGPVMSTTAVRQPGTMRATIPGPSAVRSAQPRFAARAQNARPATQRITVPTPAPGLVPISDTNGNIRPGTLRVKPLGKTKATEESSVGGILQKTSSPAVPGNINAGKPSAQVVDLTDDDGKSQGSNMAADSREIMINKLSGKTYPSLVVVARPNLRSKEFSQQQITSERSALDAKMKAVLMGSPTKFTEWLIQQGLVRSDQYCSVHINADMSPVKLKLGMYSDVSKFPYSGGYVWISECCPQRFVSVFSGSIFEGAPHSPTVLVKLLYHWACQTGVNNISSWVKVDGLYVKSFYTNIRAVCTAAVAEKFEKLGGPKKRVELGVISLGTTSQDGNMRQVKVEVLGVYDPESKLVRLRAVEPLTDGERNYKRRFIKILEPLEEWVHKDSVILTDFTVDKGTLLSMGFQSVYQVSLNETQANAAKYSNIAVMDYLRRIVPRMFQNTLSLLSRQIIQQFLDELVWRERWGLIPARAFETMVAHLSEQTKLDTGDSLMSRLNKIAANPFKNWAYKNWQLNCASNVAAPSTRIILGTNDTVTLSQPTVSAGQSSSSGLPSIDNLPPSLRAVTSSQTPSPPPGAQGQKRGRKKALSPMEPEAKKRAMAATGVISNKLRPLDSYYYGERPGEPHVLAAHKSIELNQKCGMCHLVVKDNLKMMRHLIGHAYNEGSYTFSDSSPQCRYCLKDFLSDLQLQNHIDEVHDRAEMNCLICRESNRDRTTLIMHMHMNHVELEMPYRCNICQFRASQHNVVVDHFHEVHKNSDKLQCPFCLKIVSLQTVDGRKITQNQHFFIHHIQKHQRKTLARKCQKCVLWFVHKDLIKEHITKDHMSCRDLPDVKRFPAEGLDVVMMPTPNDKDTVLKFPSKTKLAPTLPGFNFTVNNFPGMKLEGVMSGSTCCECEGEFLTEDHFPGFLSCLKCRFSTCCNKAMAEHIAIYHDTRNPKPQFNVGKATILPKPLHCVCGFSSCSGNKLARHLVDCKRKSAYPSAERAAQCTLQGQSASFPPLINLDDEGGNEDHEEKWMRAFTQNRASADTTEPVPVASSSKGPPSMLNLLGLVRKPSTEDSLDKSPSEAQAMDLDDTVEKEIPRNKY